MNILDLAAAIRRGKIWHRQSTTEMLSQAKGKERSTKPVSAL